MALVGESKNLFESYLRINVRLLKAGGCLDERNLLRNLIGLIALGFLFVCTVAQWHQAILYSVDNKEMMTRCIGSIFSAYLAMTKGLSLIFQSRNLFGIMEHLSALWYHQYNNINNRNVMITMGKKAYRITFSYFTSYMVISLAFHCSPYKNLLNQYLWTKTENNTYNFTTIMPAKYPLDVSNVGNYAFIMLVEHTLTMFFVIYLASSDTLFSQFLTHLCLHFKLLRYDLENIIEETATTNTSNDVKLEELTIRKLSTIVERQNELYLLCRRVEKVFSLIFFISMLTTSMIMCISLYEIQKMVADGQFLECLGQFSHGIVLLAEVAIYCGYSNMLSHQTELLAIAAYNCQWPYLGKQFCSHLQILMVRAQRAYRYTAYGFFRIDLPQLSTIVSAAATYFTLLNTLVRNK